MRALWISAVLCVMVVAVCGDYASDMAACADKDTLMKCYEKMTSGNMPTCTAQSAAGGWTSIWDVATCCLKCKPPTALPTTQCPAVNTLPPCTLATLGTVGVFNIATMCLTCNLRQAIDDPTVLTPIERCDILSLPKCAPNTLPTMDKGCPTCRPDFSVCTPSSLDKCTQAPECASGVFPSLDSSCCPTCRFTPPPIPSACAKVKPNCADGKPQCAAGKAPQFDPSTCCIDCVPSTIPFHPNITAPCTLDQMKECLRSVPVCNDNQIPSATSLSCCHLCKRPEQLCSPSDVVKCWKNAPTCASGEKPQHVQGMCCPSCKPGPPTCSPACQSGLTCVKTNTCINMTHLRIELHGAGSFVSTFAGLDKGMVKDYLVEVFERYCEDPANTDKCNTVRGAIAAVEVQGVSVGASVKLWLQVPTSDGSVAVTAHGLTMQAAAITPAAVLQASLASPVAVQGDSSSALTVNTFSGDSSAAGSLVFGQHVAGTWLALCGLVLMALVVL